MSDKLVLQIEKQRVTVYVMKPDRYDYFFEDYELFSLAERKIGREKVILPIRPFVKDPFTWVNDPAVLDQVRAKLAEAAE